MTTNENSTAFSHEEDAMQVSVSTVLEQSKAEIDVQIATAKQYPRNVRRATEDAVAIATMDIETAKTCHYALPRAGKTVSGPSVHLAKIIASCWQNLRVAARVINIDRTHVTSQGIAYDLEKNIAFQVEVKRSIVGKQGRFSDDMITVTGNAANAIAMRNAIFAVLPRAVVDRVYNEAKSKMIGDVTDETKLISKRKQVLDALMDTYNVTEKQVLAAVGRASVSHITADDITTLIGVGQALKDGDTTVDEAFSAGREEKTPPQTKQGAAAKSTVASIENKLNSDGK